MYKFNAKAIFEPGNIVIPVNADVYWRLRANDILRYDGFFFVLDGAVLRYLYYILSRVKLRDNSGSLIIYDFMDLALTNDMKVLVVGGADDVELNLRRIFSQSNSWGGSVTFRSEAIAMEEVQVFAQSIDVSSYDMILVALGCPKQELLLQSLHSKGQNKGFSGLACGGALDMYTEKIKRCNPVLSRLGLEGVYRLIREPSYKRLKRLVTSLYGCVVFTNDVIRHRITLLQ